VRPLVTRADGSGQSATTGEQAIEWPSAGPRPWALLFAPVALIAFWLVARLLLAPQDPNTIDLTRTSLAPTPSHWLGTDRLGRDVLSRWLAGGASSVAIALIATLLASAIGTLLGGVAGSGRTIGITIDRGVDVSTAVPMLFLAIALSAALPPGAVGTVAVLAFAGWPSVTRVVRAQVELVRTYHHVEAAYSLGCSDARILWRHILPQCVGTVATALTVGFGEALLLQSTLSFLGLCLPPTTVTWGGMLQESMAELARGAWWHMLPPGLAILATTMAVGSLSRRLASALG
jgi:peptide/nickel transport system permease protein